jgi:formamidopyrimidine-DNA glycosylase
VPELPEVETVRAGLERHVVGRTVATAEVLNPRAVRRDLAGPDGFAAAMAGRTLLSAERRGKYLWFALDDGSQEDDPAGCVPDGKNRHHIGCASGPFSGGHPPNPPGPPTEALLAHLGMSGQLLVGDAERPLSAHVRARFTFTDGGPDLRFTDQRTFGHLMLCCLSSPGGMTPPVTPPIMGGRRPPIAPPRGDSQKPLAPRAVAGVKDQWLRSAGTAETAAPSAVSEVKALGLRSAGTAETAAPSAVAGVSAGVAGIGPGRLVPVPIVHIAPDPLEAAFDPKVFAERLARKKTQVKRALLDQSLISGIGNIYADEALWRAKLHWARPTDTLKRTEVSRLLEAVRDVLTEALKAGGTSFDALYVNVNGESGYFDRSLNAYGREGEPCGRCATPILRESFMNRSSYSCPRCQR